MTPAGNANSAVGTATDLLCGGQPPIMSACYLGKSKLDSADVVACTVPQRGQIPRFGKPHATRGDREKPKQRAHLEQRRHPIPE